MSIDLGSQYLTGRTDWAYWKSHLLVLSFCVLLGVASIMIRLVFHG